MCETDAYYDFFRNGIYQFTSPLSHYANALGNSFFVLLFDLGGKYFTPPLRFVIYDANNVRIDTNANMTHGTYYCYYLPQYGQRELFGIIKLYINTTEETNLLHLLERSGISSLESYADIILPLQKMEI